MQPRFCCLLLAAAVFLHGLLASATAWLHRHVHRWRTVFPWSRASVSAAKPKNLDTAETRGNTPPGSSWVLPSNFCTVLYVHGHGQRGCCCCADQGPSWRTRTGHFYPWRRCPLGDWNDQAGPGTPERERKRRVEGSPRGSESGGGDAAKDSMGRGPRTVSTAQHRQRQREKRTVVSVAPA